LFRKSGREAGESRAVQSTVSAK